MSRHEISVDRRGVPTVIDDLTTADPRAGVGAVGLAVLVLTTALLVAAVLVWLWWAA